ncbi:hypothetical protein DL96DRAFT_1561669 [Flagelloscypha sp. PMI_526]|nr:hypothetical protein DL96DRAFT_1561669 [Flagelloscypha sp. PMI_526]
MATLFVTQKLFMHRLLVRHQSLTQSHDQYSSWLGLASAIAALFKQRSARAGYKWIFCILIYLACSAVMKITTAALFQLSPTTIVTPQGTQATSVSSDFLTSVMRDASSDSPEESMVQYLRQAMVYEYARLGSWERSPTVDSVGLQGNALYDVIPQIANATDTVNVTSMTINANCGPLSSVDYRNWTDAITGALPPTLQAGWLLTPLSASGTLWELNQSQTHSNPFLIPFQTMFKIEDSQGTALNLTPFRDFLIDNHTGTVYFDDPSSINPLEDVGTRLRCPEELTLNVSISSPNSQSRLLWNNVTRDSGFGFFMCSLNWTEGAMLVDAVQRTPIKARERRDRSLWRETPATNNPDPDLKYTWSPSWSFFDLFADRYLRLTQRDPLQLQLHEFESMLEDWVAMNLYLYNKAALFSNSIDASNNVSVSVKSQVSQLQLRALPVFGGFAAALIMFAIASLIVFTTPAHRLHPDEIGVLQLLWLSNVKFDLGPPEAQPTEENLRKAGLSTSVSLVNGVETFRRTTKRA